ncbi:MAG: SPASM domain-containing protein [Clostridia bacterium]|nr:SPASM domain-containing protein [Clostridia bacterium]
MKKDLSIMIKPASSICNMRCKYCFYHSLAESRESFSYGIMTQSTAENLIIKALDFCDGGSIYFAFQGGEPLFAGKEFFINFVSMVDKHNTKGCKIYYNLQTNGTLIDQEWADFFAENKFLLGLSLDGDQDANRFRLDRDLNYTFPTVKASMDLLKERGVDFNVLIVSTGYTADHIESVYKYFKSQDIKFLQFIPCLRPFGDKSESDLYMTVSQYSSFLIKLFNLYVKDYVKGEYVSIRQFDNYVRLFWGEHAEQCGMNGFCSRQFVIESNGNVYPCDFYCLDEWLLGNVNSNDFTQLASAQKADEFTRGSFSISSKCKACPYVRLCRGGGCKRSKEDRDYCQAYQQFFGACLPLFRVFINEKRKA